jgi:hypothetical protein
MNEKYFFQFESDFIASLRCIPMQVRMNLDTCGIKLKLTDWSSFSLIERQELMALPCNTREEINAYRDFIQLLTIEKTGSPAKDLDLPPHPEWLDETKIPSPVLEKLTELNLSLSIPQWSSLTPIQRFALIKLSRPSHENSNFLPALKEFNLV